MKKFLLSFVALFAMASFAFAEDVTVSWTGQSDWTGVAEGANEISYTQGDISIVVSKESGQTKPTVNASSNDLRSYAKNNVKISCSTSGMTKMVFNISTAGKKRLTELTATSGSLAYDTEAWTVTWTGDANEVTFTVGDKATLGTEGSAKAGQFDFDNLVVTTGGEGGGETPEPEPEPEPEPTPEYASIAEIKAGGEGDAVLNLTNAVVTYVNGLNAYLEDATGGILVYTSGHGLEAGQAINGKVNVSYVLYGGTTAELTKFDASAATVTDGNTIPVTEVSVAELLANTAKYESMRVKVSNAVVTAAFENRNASISQNGNEIGLYQKDKNATLGIAAGDKVHVVGYPGFYRTTPQLNVWEEGDITEDTSSISNALVGEKAAKVYSIDGRQLNSPAKGINIINGKKVLVK